MSEKPAVQTTSISNPIDISATEDAEFVYVKMHEPKHGLSPRFEGPFRVVSRPSRSQVQVRVGSFVDGRPRLSTFHWSSCKVAHVRPDTVEASRPNIGRKPKDKSGSDDSPTSGLGDGHLFTDNKLGASPPSNVNKPVAILKDRENSNPSTSSNPSAASNSKPTDKGPVFTQEMFDRWTPDLLGIPQPSARPVRSSRNPNPNYIGAIAA